MAKFVKGQSGNPKGRPPAGLSNAEILRAAAMSRLQKPLEPGSKQTTLEAMTDTLAIRAAAGDYHAYETLLKMLGAFDHTINMKLGGMDDAPPVKIEVVGIE